MTIVLESLVDLEDKVEWKTIRSEYERVKPTWQNIRRIVQEYQRKYPDADDTKLSELTGFSVPQIETVTHSAHKRCLAYMLEHPRAQHIKISKECGVSQAFASRIYKQLREGAKIPKGERYLFEGVDHG